MWRWETSGSRMDYTDWSPGQPNIFCIHIPGHWIGGSDRGQEGMWRWVTSGSRLNYRHWHLGKPGRGGGEDCLAMWFADGRWWDAPCHYNYPYICESV